MFEMRIRLAARRQVGQTFRGGAKVSTLLRSNVSMLGSFAMSWLYSDLLDA